MSDRVDDRPVNARPATTYDDLWRIVTHPAFRLGFLDAQAGRTHDHDRIAVRILAETPSRALQALGYANGLFPDEVALAQYRYEEGRCASVELGLRCKAWNHPDYPPAAIRKFIDARVAGAVIDSLVAEAAAA